MTVRSTIRSAILVVALSATPLAGQEPIEVPVAGGAPFTGLAAGAPDAGSAVLVVHDWFGVTGATRETVARLAGFGYRVLAVDLYGGESATTHDRAGELMGGLDPARTMAVLQAGLDALGAGRRPVAVLGFSMGGGPAMRIALAEPELVSAVAVVYGGGIEGAEVEAYRRLGGPVLAVTGSEDAWALDSALALLTRLAEAGRGLELYVIPGARHAYAQPLYAGGENYDPVATRSTWNVLDDFLARAIGSG